MLATIHSFPVAQPLVPERTPRNVSRWIATVVGGALLIGGLLVYGADGEGRAVRELPPDTRAALLSRTLQNLRSVCSTDSNGSFRELCEDQARLALAFPECDGECNALAREALRHPTR